MRTTSTEAWVWVWACSTRTEPYDADAVRILEYRFERNAHLHTRIRSPMRPSKELRASIHEIENFLPPVHTLIPQIPKHSRHCGPYCGTVIGLYSLIFLMQYREY